MVYYAISKNNSEIFPVLCESFMSAKKVFRKKYDIDRKEGEGYIIFSFDDLLKLIFTKEVFETSPVRYEQIRRSKYYEEYRRKLLNENINVYNTEFQLYENITVGQFLEVENKLPYIFNMREIVKYEEYIPLVNTGDIC